MPSTQKCPRCGTEFHGGELEGLCEKCLAQAAFGLSVEKDGHAKSGRLRFGDFELLQEVGRGGMGVVYKARQISLDRIVAVKMMLAGHFASEPFIQRFRAEAQAAASLHHPNIVAIHEVGEVDGHLYFSMDFVEGRSLSDLVRENPLPAKAAAGCLQIIAEAIHYAHQRGTLHRDLKPSNVLMDHFNQPRITDFGLAKRVGDETTLTDTGQVLGSVHYMPPEQASGKSGAAGPANDVYSLGAILYHLLTGRPPFLAETFENTLLQLLIADPVPPRLLNPGIPKDLETLCLKCLEKDPRRRYQSAQELADEFGRYLRDEPIVARPVGSMIRAWRWCRRKPAVAGLLAALVAAFLIGFAGVSWQWRRAEVGNETARAYRYFTDMNLALNAWQHGNRAQAFGLLQRQRPKPGESDLRGFAWRHLWWLARGNYATALPEHPQVVGGISFSPRGDILGAYSWDDKIRLWNLKTQENLFTFTNATALAGFAKGGEEFVVGHTDGLIRICRASTGETLRSIPNAGEIVAFASGTATVATIDRDRFLSVWNLATPHLKFTIPEAVRRRSDYGWGASVVISHDGGVLAIVQAGNGTHSPDRGVKLWNIETGKELPFLTEGRQIRCMLFSPDDERLAIGDDVGLVRIWNLDSRKDVRFAGHELPVISLAFSPDGQTLATGSSDQSIKLWDLNTGLQKPRNLRGQIGAVWAMAFSPDGKHLASGSRDMPVKIWDPDATEPPDTADGLHSEDWGNFTFSPDARWMAAGCKNNRVKVWSVSTFELIKELPGASYVVAFSSKGTELLAADSDGKPLWWDVVTGNRSSIPNYQDNIRDVTAAVLSTDRHLAALGRHDGAIEILEINTGKRLAKFKAHEDAVLSISFSPHGDKIMSGGRDRSVKVWDAGTQQSLGVSFEHRGSVCAITMSHDGKTMASACGANTIKFWSPNQVSARSTRSLHYHGSAIRTLDFSPDDQTLASGSEDRTVKLWNVALHQEVASFMFDSHVRHVAFSPDNMNLAVVTDRGTLRLLRSVTFKEADRFDRELLRPRQ